MEDSEEIIAEGSVPNNFINVDEGSKSTNTKGALLIDEKWNFVKENIVGSSGYFSSIKTRNVVTMVKTFETIFCDKFHSKKYITKYIQS